ncbi:efflux transporter outer membrane subunit [Paraburkholderia silviterrae]|uniref:Efflux transporter outer membrane subunit n=1 Tax=Paraburkholderia silviterrae TaxID=2528715 RepID=A0A4R5M946_9BURK|nr:efflux transporter outer membrane subunit [Paraburkholderia silviterrae]TDG23129.1 efflux transporter outer membrane subunit [Paraburkholderia silviterrae]
MPKSPCLSLTLACTLLLSACANTDGIASRSTVLDARTVAAGGAIQAALADASWPQERWWTRWSDPQLDQLISLAVAGSPQMGLAQARIDQAEALARIAGAVRDPTISAGGEFSRRRFSAYANPNPPGGSTVWNNAVDVGLLYELDLWGKNRATHEGALDTVQAATADAREAQLLLEASVVRMYVTLSLQYDLRDVEVQTLERELRIVDILERRGKAGLAGRLEISEAHTPVAATRAQIAQYERQIALGRNQLAVLTGQGPGAGERLARPSLRLDVPIALPATLPAELVGHRPDVVAQRWRVEAAAKAIKVAHADFYPNIDLIATASLASAAFGGFFTFVNSSAADHSFGVAISLPIFDGGLRKGRYGVAVADYDQAVDLYNQTVLAAFQGVADQVVSLRSLETQQRDVENSLQSAREAFDYAEKGYRIGMTDYLNVLATQTELLRAQQSLALTRAARLDAWAQLMTALGGGMQTASAPPEGVTRHAP